MSRIGISYLVDNKPVQFVLRVSDSIYLVCCIYPIWIAFNFQFWLKAGGVPSARSLKGLPRFRHPHDFTLLLTRFW
jgi:hypothetical protein